MSNNKISRSAVPEGFTLSLAFVDALPVIFFAGTMILISFIFKSAIFLIGALLCFYAGAAKVLWKIIVVLKRKNVWWLFMQMRIVMPIGFLLMIVALIVGREALDGAVVIQAITSLPQVVFFGLGILGMIMMMVFAFRLDSSDARSNWIEQITNGLAQLCIFIGTLLILVIR